MLTKAGNIDHQAHPFELPSYGTVIRSPVTEISYEIGNRLGAGGFGTVFECVDDWDDALVAKVLRPVGDSGEMEIRATSEVLAAAIARSEHIVHVADAFIYRGAYYIISESCDLSLRDMMDNKKISRSVWFPSMAKAILHGLHFMHTQGLVHCDVHEGNVLLHRKGCTLNNEDYAYDFKLGDFGQTRTLDVVSPQATWNETCLPPEVLDTNEFGPVDRRADLYQAGLLFLRFLSTNLLEFDSEDILSGRPREIAESLPHPASDAISKLVRRHATCRPASALEAWHSIKNHLHVS